MEAPITTADTAPVTGGVAPTGRGRGGGRGSYEGRGRGRGMGRGSYSGMGSSSGYPSRGGYGPRGGGSSSSPMGYQGRGGYAARGAPPMRGSPSMSSQGGYSSRGSYQGAPRGNGSSMRGSGRMPLYSQPSANNQVVAIKSDNDAVPTEETTAVISGDPNALLAAPPTATPLMSKPLIPGPGPGYRGRGRGGPRGGSRGGGGGSYNPHNGSSSGMMSMHGSSMQEHGGPPRRGGPSRGRGSYQGSSMTRPPLHHSPHSGSSQMPPQSLKRGAPGGPPGPKRGRYEAGPYTQRAPTPKYHQAPHVPPQPTNYAVQHQPAPPPQQTHMYPTHVAAPAVDPYAQPYTAPQAQTTYNGYGQATAYTHAAPTHAPTQQANHAYAATEYDQSQYQGYSSTYAQQDTRYQTYGQDYTQQYGAPAVDYNTSQPDYSQHAQQTYDERAYAGYDTQSYQQSYANAGYY